MCNTCQNISVYATTEGYDPSRTTTLRNAFAAQFRRRFRMLRGVIRHAIVDDDVFALSNRPRLSVNQLSSPGPRAFDFPRTQDKVNAFMQWLKAMETEIDLKIVNFERAGRSVDSAWANQYVFDSYARGVDRAAYEMDSAGFEVPSMQARGGIQAAMQTPIHMDRVGLLYTRVYNELNGITDAMDQQISRVLAQGMIDGDNPRVLARKINKVIEGLGADDLGLRDSLGRFIPARRRAEMLARTEIIRAHAEAQLVEYENWMDEVTIRAEWSTAGDSRVCERCGSREGQVLTIAEARGLIPLHPNCRCIWLPYNAEVTARRGART